MAKKAHNETIEDITDGCDKECILKVLARRSGLQDRGLEQFACIGIFKKEIEKEEGKRYTWTEICDKWAHEGYAEKFAKAYEKYEHHLRAKGFYNIVMGRKPLDNEFIQ